jgi:DNA polymerase-3 subunit gamma/tau
VAPASLYRRHRPRTFDDVVGQDHVVRTLRNAIEQGKVHHAYLFVGSRGTGKTSMAKILAASLNCVNGPTVTPCGECESCRSIAAATSLDVIEMDAASNNSVDDIRDLRERVSFAPVAGRHKVYILDEAHMLSTAAWNAFLKTLEEPPPHTIFVLATTEAAKVLPTVVDRCHRFDFARPSAPQIAGVIRKVADAESIAIGDEATALVARSATGSFRDALGTLEQLVAYSGREISLDDVLAVLGAADADLVFGAVDAIAAGDVRAALLAASRLADSGRDLGRFFGDLEAHTRALMVVQALGELAPELRVTPEQDERLVAQAKAITAIDVVRLLELIAAALRAMKDGADARTQLDLVLVKAAEPAHDPSTKALLSRIERLEGRGPAPAPAHDPDQPATAAGRTKAAVSAPEPSEPEPEARAAVAAVAVVEAKEGNGELTLAAFAEVWPAVVQSLESESPRLAAILQEARPTALEERDLTIAWPESAAFSKRQAEDPEKRELIAQSIRDVTGATLRLAYELGGEHAPAAPSLTEDELVDRFKQEFGAVEEPKEES